MRTRSVAAWVLLAAAGPCVPDALSAQRYWPLANLTPGDTLRVWSLQPRLAGMVGVLTRVRHDTIGLGDLPRGRATPTPSPRLELPVAAFDRIQVRRGNHRSAVGIVGGVLIGGAAGLAIGLRFGPRLACGGGCSRGGRDPSSTDSEVNWLVGQIVGGFFGTITGAGIAGSIGGRSQATWIEVH